MRKFLFGILFVSIAYSSHISANDIILINKLKDDLAVNYMQCDRDHFCGGEESVTVPSTSYKVIEDLDPTFFSYMKATKASAKNSGKKGKFPASGLCKVALNIGGILVFDDYNTNRIICTKG